MQLFKSLLALSLLGATPLVAQASNGQCTYNGNPCTTVTPPAIATPANMGQYCSIVDSAGNWSLIYFTDLTSDPCGSTVPSNQIARAGLFSTTGINNVLEKCNGKIGKYRGVGLAPMDDAFQDADGANRTNCTFTVSPDVFPIFDSPFRWWNSVGYAAGTGYDFARSPYGSIPLVNGGHTLLLDAHGVSREGTNIAALATSTAHATPFSNRQIKITAPAGYTGGTNHLGIEDTAHFQRTVTCTGLLADGVTFTGCSTDDTVWADQLLAGGNVSKPLGFIDDHSAHDYLMNENTQILAAADGVVDMVRARKTDVNAACDYDSHGNFTGDQVEVYVRHRITGGGGTTRYDEQFETIYDHLSSTNNLHIGDIVHKGDLLGHSGHTGCTSGTPHMHFAVLRMTNTSSYRSYPYVINVITAANAGDGSDNGGENAIEPDGYAPPSSDSFDPFAWRPLLSGSTWGAFSPYLWKDTSAQQQRPPMTNGW